jgi:hypothetical protein
MNSAVGSQSALAIFASVLAFFVAMVPAFALLSAASS